MKNHKTLVGAVIVWGLLGVGIYTAFDTAMVYFRKSPAVPESLKVGVNQIKSKINKISEKTAEKMKKSILTEKQQVSSQHKGISGLLQSENKIEEDNSPVKRLGRIADNYMDEESGVETVSENKTPHSIRQKSAHIDIQEPIAASEDRITMHDREQKVFARQLSVVDELLDQ